MRMYYFLFFILSVYVLFVHCNLDNVYSTAETLTFEDNLIGIRFEYPTDWTVEGYNLYKTDLSECSTLPCIRLPEISIDIKPIVPTVFSLENYVQEQNQSKSFLGQYNLLEINKTKIGSKDAIQHIYLSELPSIGEEFIQKIIKYDIYTTEGGNLYKLSLTAKEDQDLSSTLGTFRNILKTFEIIK